MIKALANWILRSKVPLSINNTNRDAELLTTDLAGISEPRCIQLASYDENLLERSRTQWQFGDWMNLAKLGRETLHDHPERAKLALLVAAAHQQVGNSVAARQFARLSIDWGCSKKLASQILISGVHNTLGRASVISGRDQRAIEHFNRSVSIANPGGDLNLILRARINKQLAQLGERDINVSLTYSGDVAEESKARRRNYFKVIEMYRQDLGLGWAANTINTVIFRHHGILTHGNRQSLAFYVDEHTLRLVQRDLSTGILKTNDISGDYNLRDAHNSISLGVDRAGHLHISYDHHASKLRYRRSTCPHSIADWTDELPMTHHSEAKVTYPTFILPHDNYPLTLLYRDGGHDKGTARIKTYDEENLAWTDHPLPILSGAEQKPWTSNAYWNHPAVGTDGTLHLSFVWRTHTLGEEERINNINIGYACSSDNGITWFTSRQRPYRLPITQVNAETIHAVSPGSNLINQTSMALDSYNRPHIVFYADDPNGIPQYQHLWFDGKAWHNQVISNRHQPFNLHGHGTLQVLISRPEILIDRDDNVYVIYRGDMSQNKMAAILLSAPDYTWSADSQRPLWDEDVGFAEPLIDRSRWQRDNILSLLLQHNDQPNHDSGHLPVSHPVTLVDVILEPKP